MLLNSKGQIVKLASNLNTIDNPGVFRNLREIKEPENSKHVKMFQLGERARFVNARQAEDVQ